MNETGRRPALFADRLYPADPARWSPLVEWLTRPGPGLSPSRALLLPHGGAEACGPLLDLGLAALAEPVREILLLGPVHDPGPDTPPLSAEPRARWEVPGGHLEVGEPWAGIPVHEPTSNQEHSLEVVAAWLSQRRLVVPKIWPVLVAPGCPWSRLAQFSRLLTRWLEEDACRALICTTDLDHYRENSDIKSLHGGFLDELSRGAAHAFQERIERGQLAPCGAAPTWVYMSVGRRLGWAPTVLGYGWGPSGVGAAVGFAVSALDSHE